MFDWKKAVEEFQAIHGTESAILGYRLRDGTWHCTEYLYLDEARRGAGSRPSLDLLEIHRNCGSCRHFTTVSVHARPVRISRPCTRR